MKKNKKKKHFKNGIIGYIQKILTIVIITMIVVFLLSLFLKREVNRLRNFATIGILGVGTLSLLGGTKITYDPKYNYHKAMTGLTSNTKNDINQLRDSYSFFIFMAITAGILYIGSLLF